MDQLSNAQVETYLEGAVAVQRVQVYVLQHMLCP
jgi:hypothetical protein